MKKKILCLVMMAIMVVGMGTTANAADYQGKDGWMVEFVDDEMKSNFKSSDVTEEVSNVQPGDSITLKVQLKNSESFETDWYMTNTVLKTLEDAKSQADGGGYEYRLSYVDHAGNEKVLYDSENVGGEKESAAGEGLHEATNSLEDYFYLDRIAPGESGTVRLRLAVDGETQGNGYQETFAALQMNFAAEEVLVDTTTDRVVRETVKTGDTNKVFLLCALALISGIVLLFFGLRSMKDKRWKKMLMSLLVIGMLLGLNTGNVQAADKPYTYTVTLSAGNKGLIGGSEKVVKSKLNAGDIVNFDLSQVTVTDEKYYVKGIRLSGRDNEEAVQAAAFVVTGDEDYVVAYGIKGDQVAYTVNYQDADGNELAPSNTFYGNVGDKPVVAYRYIENYIPEALAITKTLSENKAENVFTFVYNPGETGAVTENITTITTVIPGTATPGTGAAGTTGTTGDGAGNADTDADQEMVESPDEETPQSLVDLDDEETPKGNMIVDKDIEKGLPLVGMIAIIVAAAAGLTILIMVLKKRTK